jgi:hypothetical protein
MNRLLGLAGAPGGAAAHLRGMLLHQLHMLYQQLQQRQVCTGNKVTSEQVRERWLMGLQVGCCLLQAVVVTPAGASRSAVNADSGGCCACASMVLRDCQLLHSRLRVSQVTANVGFLCTMWGAKVRDLMVAPADFVAAACSRRPTASEACWSMMELQRHGLLTGFCTWGTPAAADCGWDCFLRRFAGGCCAPRSDGACLVLTPTMGRCFFAFGMYPGCVRTPRGTMPQSSSSSQRNYVHM